MVDAFKNKVDCECLCGAKDIRNSNDDADMVPGVVFSLAVIARSNSTTSPRGLVLHYLSNLQLPR